MKGPAPVSSPSPVKVSQPVRTAPDEDGRAPREKVTLSSPPSVASLLYARPAAAAATDGLYAQLKEQVLKTLTDQGISADIATGEGTTTPLTDMTPDQAKALVAEDGYWGVKQTSQRIADLAIGLAGGDANKAESVMKALEKGFGQAREAFGGKLPDISEQTIAAVREKIAAWATTATSEA